MEGSLYEVALMRHFAGLALNDDRIPDERTILQFRHLLARHHLRQGWFEAVQRHLREQGYPLSKGTRVEFGEAGYASDCYKRGARALGLGGM